MRSSNEGSVLVIAPHPDDEVLGVGGTFARLADEGCRVTVAIVTKGSIEHFDAALIERGRQEAREAHRLLGVAETVFLDLPAARLDQIPHVTINAALLQVIEQTRPRPSSFLSGATFIAITSSSSIRRSSQCDQRMAWSWP